jgi:hypothetical protein
MMVSSGVKIVTLGHQGVVHKPLIGFKCDHIDTPIIDFAGSLGCRWRKARNVGHQELWIKEVVGGIIAIEGFNRRLLHYC